MVRIWQEERIIPTYGVGQKDKNPMFFEKRVYQGSSGKIYPYPVVDKIEDVAKRVAHRIIAMENDYVLIWVMPDLGGRIYRALDKTNGYDFIYYNEVIKPALVGLAGPWISGGIEFNWPQHHRPSTYEPVDFTLEEGEGYVCIKLYEIDRMHGTSANVSLILREGHSYLEIHGDLYNRTDVQQTFLWWANPAVAVNDWTQSIFPPDVTAVYDHGKRDVSAFPIARGTYYKVDYSAGVDISRYKNIPVPTSYMAYRSNYDFIGGYDEKAKAGMLHVADHHVAPGKKQWTWGNGDFGRTWDDNLTDQNGPYIELMTGIYTDNQPDFAWLAPHESKTFVQYFLPYRAIGNVLNANRDLAMSVTWQKTGFLVGIAATSPTTGLKIVIEPPQGDAAIATIERVAPDAPAFVSLSVSCDGRDAWRAIVLAPDGSELLRYQNDPVIEPLPSPAKASPKPADVKSNDELFIIASHLEQYRHATYRAEDYYREGLRRDPDDLRHNTGYGRLLLNQGRNEEALGHFDRAIGRLWFKNERAYDGEPLYLKALALTRLGRDAESETWYRKAAWSLPQRAASLLRVGQIKLAKERPLRVAGHGSDARRRAAEALCFFDEALLLNGGACRIKTARVTALRRAGLPTQAATLLDELRRQNPLELAVLYETALADPSFPSNVKLREMIADNIHQTLELENDYVDMGLWDEAGEILERYLDTSKGPLSPLAFYHLAFVKAKMGDPMGAAEAIRRGEQADPTYCFPNKPGSRAALEFVVESDPTAAMAKYYLGLLYYDVRHYDRAIGLWEASAAMLPTFATVHRNLGIACFNILRRPAEALDHYRKAFAADPSDSRILYEYDQLRKRTNQSPSDRLDLLERYAGLIGQRDDLYLEYVTLLNLVGRPDAALKRLETRRFHVWEGGEGLVSKQYVIARMALSRRVAADGDSVKALQHLALARVWPKNLGEGRLPGTPENHLDYEAAVLSRACGKDEQAISLFERAARGSTVVQNGMFYNDQPSDIIFFQGLALSALGRREEAAHRFSLLRDYAEKHMNDQPEIDYFAVSLPTFLIFEDDLVRRNAAYCHYLAALSAIGEARRDDVHRHLAALSKIAPEYQGLYDITEA